MKNKKLVIDGYIVAVGDIVKGTEITAEEYERILKAQKSLVRREGYSYKLHDDTLTYDEFKIPTEETDEREELSNELSNLSV